MSLLPIGVHLLTGLLADARGRLARAAYRLAYRVWFGSSTKLRVAGDAFGGPAGRTENPSGDASSSSSTAQPGASSVEPPLDGFRTSSPAEGSSEPGTSSLTWGAEPDGYSREYLAAMDAEIGDNRRG